MTTTYFWSDTHFAHAGILKFTSRPYATVEAMNEGMIERWNSVVGPNDRAVFGGDFAFATAGFDLGLLFSRLHGHKILVRGNHDENNKKVLRLPWESQHDLLTVREGTMRAVVCHYPLDTWKHPDRYLMLHGHSHGTLETYRPRRFDIGADVFWTPVSFEELYDRAPEYVPVDHHGRESTGVV